MGRQAAPVVVLGTPARVGVGEKGMRALFSCALTTRPDQLGDQGVGVGVAWNAVDALKLFEPGYHDILRMCNRGMQQIVNNLQKWDK